MNIHKFNIKPKDKQYKTIKWIIPDDIRQYVKKLIHVLGRFLVKKILYYNLKKLNIYFLVWVL